MTIEITTTETVETVSTEDNSIEELIDQENSHQETIETVIATLEENNSAMVLKNDDGSYIWKFQYGSVEVFVQLTGETDEDLLTVWASVLTFPANDELGLMRRLLEMNWSGTFETCFAIFNNQIVVSTQRTVADLSAGEISRAITLVATIADDNDEALKMEFGGS